MLIRSLPFRFSFRAFRPCSSPGPWALRLPKARTTEVPHAPLGHHAGRCPREPGSAASQERLRPLLQDFRTGIDGQPRTPRRPGDLLRDGLHHRAEPDHPGLRRRQVPPPSRQRPAGHRHRADGGADHRPDGPDGQRPHRRRRRPGHQRRRLPPARPQDELAGCDGHGRARRSGADGPGRLGAAAAGDGRDSQRAAAGHRHRHRPVHLAGRPRRRGLRHP